MLFLNCCINDDSQLDEVPEAKVYGRVRRSTTQLMSACDWALRNMISLDDVRRKMNSIKTGSRPCLEMELEYLEKNLDEGKSYSHEEIFQYLLTREKNEDPEIKFFRTNPHRGIVCRF